MPSYRLKNDRLLEVTIANEKVLARAGAMVAYDGKVAFEKALLGGEGLFGALKRKAVNESFDLMTTSGNGTVYFAHEAQEVSILALQGEKVFIESTALLAFDAALTTKTAFAGLRGATSGQGLFTTTVEGQGSLAVISRGPLIGLAVDGSQPLFVDPGAFVAYKGNIQQEFVFDVNWKTMIGQSSGESYQLKFTGVGVVYIQPTERV